MLLKLRAKCSSAAVNKIALLLPTSSSKNVISMSLVHLGRLTLQLDDVTGE